MVDGYRVTRSIRVAVAVAGDDLTDAGPWWGRAGAARPRRLTVWFGDVDGTVGAPRMPLRARRQHLFQESPRTCVTVPSIESVVSCADRLVSPVMCAWAFRLTGTTRPHGIQATIPKVSRAR